MINMNANRNSSENDRSYNAAEQYAAQQSLQGMDGSQNTPEYAAPVVRRKSKVNWMLVLEFLSVAVLMLTVGYVLARTNSGDTTPVASQIDARSTVPINKPTIESVLMMKPTETSTPMHTATPTPTPTPTSTPTPTPTPTPAPTPAPTPTPEPRLITLYTTNRAKLRSGPSRSAEQIGSLGKGVAVRAYDELVPSTDGSKPWYKVQNGDGFAYISSGLLTTEKPSSR